MRFLSNKEKKELKEKLPNGYSFEKKDEITQKENIIYKNKEPFLLTLEKNIFLPHLKSLNSNAFKSVYVDKGAIPFIIKGADLMRPGIQKIEDNIEKDEVILIKDENHNKVLAVGFSLFNSEDLKKQDKGKSVNIVHYISDDFY